MRWLKILALLPFVLALPLAAADETKLTVDVSGLFWTRTAGPTLPLVSLNTAPGSGDVFTTKTVALTTWKPGGDVRLGIGWGQLGAEVRGFMLAKWTRSALFTGAGTSLVIETDPRTSYGLPAGATIAAANESRLKGIEANLTYDLIPAVCVYAGARYVLIDETFDLFGDFGAGDTEEDIWTVKNKMLGGQIGVRADILRPAEGVQRGFTVQARGAFALFSDSASVDFEVVDTAVASAAKRSHISPAVDAGLRFGYRLDRMIELYIGYDLLWLNAVAQATHQVAGTTAFGLPPTSTLVFNSFVVHGARAGLTVRF